MNKIILDNESVINLIVEEDSICNIKNNNELVELNIILKDNINLIKNEYIEIIKKDYKINVVQNNNTNFIYNHSFKCSKLYNLNMFIDMIGNCSKNDINIYGISDFGTSNIIVDGNVDNNTFDNELDEKIKVLNINDGKTNIFPNMYINTKNVIANHAATISDINEDYLFYLNCKGINNELAKYLIIDGFLKNDAN